jgi:hypothetical protein
MTVLLMMTTEAKAKNFILIGLHIPSVRSCQLPRSYGLGLFEYAYCDSRLKFS